MKYIPFMESKDQSGLKLQKEKYMTPIFTFIYADQ
jgi:hypothetical protein